MKSCYRGACFHKNCYKINRGLIHLNEDNKLCNCCSCQHLKEFCYICNKPSIITYQGFCSEKCYKSIECSEEPTEDDKINMIQECVNEMYNINYDWCDNCCNSPSDYLEKLKRLGVNIELSYNDKKIEPVINN